jgi:hypothetical protein
MHSPVDVVQNHRIHSDLSLLERNGQSIEHGQEKASVDYFAVTFVSPVLEKKC